MLTENSIKQSLKLDYKRILLTVILFFASIFFTSTSSSSVEYCRNAHDCTFSNSVKIGYPFRFITNIPDFNYFNLVLNLIFWYIISCFLILVWDKIKGKFKSQSPKVDNKR